mmetsp:Transcript_30819/g.61117  ORF Transcript_30819/g.61117 Transcript_30819/m.61117 type:complete len:211 (-) Transcript_30819:369-1001(-)
MANTTPITTCLAEEPAPAPQYISTSSFFALSTRATSRSNSSALTQLTGSSSSPSLASSENLNKVSVMQATTPGSPHIILWQLSLTPPSSSKQAASRLQAAILLAQSNLPFPGSWYKHASAAARPIALYTMSLLFQLSSTAAARTSNSAARSPSNSSVFNLSHSACNPPDVLRYTLFSSESSIAILKTSPCVTSPSASTPRDSARAAMRFF